MKKIVYLFLTCALFCPANYANFPETNSQNSEYVKADDESLYNFVQARCSYYMGAAFARSSLTDRKALYDRIINDCVGTHNIGTTVFHKKLVEKSVHCWLADFAIRKAYQWAQQQGADQSYATTFPDQVKKDIDHHLSDVYRRSYSFGAPQASPELPEKFFEPYLAQPPATYLAPEETDNTQDSSHNATRLWSNFINSLVELFSPDAHNQQRPEATPATIIQPPLIPSAPPLEDNLPATKLFPTDECGASCFTNFKDDHVERIFLPCGHNFCADCLKSWMHTSGHSSCPQCRYNLVHGQRTRIFEVLRNKSLYCAGCNTGEGPFKTLTCKHKLCSACIKGWRSTPFANTCPRCCNTMRNPQ